MDKKFTPKPDVYDFKFRRQVRVLGRDNWNAFRWDDTLGLATSSSWLGIWKIRNGTPKSKTELLARLREHIETVSSEV